MKRVMTTLSAFALVAVFATGALAGNYGKKKDIVETAVAAGSFNTLATALTEAGLVDALKGEGPFTVFAPTDDAFAKLPKGTVETLLKPENKDKLVAILKYHVVAGKVKAEKVVHLDAAETLNGQRVDIKVDGKTVSVDNAKVTKTDIMASNGVIHVIDTVILPTESDIVGVANEAGTFKTLIAAVKAAGLAETLMGEGPFTVFAPTDDAFAKLADGTVESLLKKENRAKLQTILKYHVVSGRVFSGDVVKADAVATLAQAKVNVSVKGDTPFVNDARIVATDIDATNGVIHVIDGVLMPPMQSSSVHSKVLIKTAASEGCATSCSAKQTQTAQVR